MSVGSHDSFFYFNVKCHAVLLYTLYIFETEININVILQRANNTFKILFFFLSYTMTVFTEKLNILYVDSKKKKEVGLYVSWNALTIWFFFANFRSSGTTGDNTAAAF